MKERYEGLSRDCELVVDQLRRQVIALEGHLKSLPQDSQFKAAGLTLEQKEEIRKLRTELQTELDAVRKDLDFYKKIQGKLETIVKEVDVAAKGRCITTTILRVSNAIPLFHVIRYRHYPMFLILL